MKTRPTFRLLITSALVGVLCQGLPPSIGIATAVGPFFVNSSSIEGNANLFEGSEVKTGKASSRILLQDGATLTLGTNSAASIYKDRVVLEQGATKVENMTSFRVLAKDYRVEPQAPGAQAVVRLNGDVVEVGALMGSLSVFDRKGALLTHVGAGTATAFQTDSGGGNSGSGSNGGGPGDPKPNVNTGVRFYTAATLLGGATLAGLGLAIDAIVQSGPSSR